MARDSFESDVLPLFEWSRPDWLAQARSIARDLGKDGALVCIDDVRSLLSPPPNKDPRVMGAVFKKDDWILVKRERSARRKCHNRPISFWQLRNSHLNNSHA